MAAGDLTPGRRVADGTEPHEYEPGDYGVWEDMWCGRCPGPVDAEYPRLANLSGHQVTEHDDGTITVQPSILVNSHRPAPDGWHGFLERGTWREV